MKLNPSDISLPLGGLSFSLGDIIIPNEKFEMINTANKQVDVIRSNYNMGLITNNERYNQVIDIWTSTNAELTELSMKRIREDQQGFNRLYDVRLRCERV